MTDETPEITNYNAEELAIREEPGKPDKSEGQRIIQYELGPVNNVGIQGYRSSPRAMPAMSPAFAPRR